VKKVFHFEAPRENYHCDAAILWCFDHRFDLGCRKFLKRIGVANSDPIKVAGGAKCLASPEHEAEFRATCTSRHVLAEQFRRLGPVTEVFTQGLIEARGGSAGYHMSQILKLADKVGNARVVEALRHAARYGAFDHNAVARIVAGKPAKPRSAPEATNGQDAPRTLSLPSPGGHQRPLAGYRALSTPAAPPQPPARAAQEDDDGE